MNNYHLLLVDDDPFILEGIGDDLVSNGYHVTRASSGEAALELLESIQFDLVITDLVMDTTDGIQVLKKNQADQFRYPGDYSDRLWRHGFSDRGFAQQG